MENIKYKLQKIDLWFKSTNRLTFVIFLTITLCVIPLIFNLAGSFIKEKDIVWFDFPGKDESAISIFFEAIILAPIIETLLNQSLPYYLLNKVKYLKERSYLILLISALFFGLMHCYSLFYMIFGFLIGFVLMCGYMIRIKTDNKTYYLIVICHSLVNLGVFIKNLF